MTRARPATSRPGGASAGGALPVSARQYDRLARSHSPVSGRRERPRLLSGVRRPPDQSAAEGRAAQERDLTQNHGFAQSQATCRKTKILCNSLCSQEDKTALAGGVARRALCRTLALALTGGAAHRQRTGAAPRTPRGHPLSPGVGPVLALARERAALAPCPTKARRARPG